MPTFEFALDIEGNRESIFALTQDYDRRLDWDPFLKEARLLDGATRAVVGARAWCVATTGLGMETEYVSLNAPSVAAVRMTRGPWILRSFAGSWRLSETAPGVVRVAFRYYLEARPQFLAWALDPLLMIVFRRDTIRRLRALKRAVENP